MKSSNQQVTNIVDYLFLFPLGTNSETIIHEMPELYLKRKSLTAHRGSHSLAYKIFLDISRTPKTFSRTLL